MKLLNQETIEKDGKIIITQTTEQEVDEQELLNQIMEKRRLKADIIRRMEDLKVTYTKLEVEESDLKKLIELLSPKPLPSL